MPNKQDFSQWEKDNNKSMKQGVDYFLGETTPTMRQVFWLDVYKVNKGEVKNMEPDFEKKKEKTAGERLDNPLNKFIAK